MKRLPLLLLGVAALAGLGLLSSVVTHGFQDMAEAEQEKQRLEADRARLESSIAEIESTLEAVRSNPEAVESLARRELGWIRPGERVVILTTPTPAHFPASLTEPTATPILAYPE